jgi:DNA-binding transcriptional ArsR family regulator
MVTELDAAFVALADPTRRQVVDLLRECPRRAGQLAAACGMSGPAMSKHLRVLRDTGLVEGQRVAQDARVHLYQLRPEPFVALQAWLDQVHAYWADQLAAFKSHAEQIGGTGAGRAASRGAARDDLTTDHHRWPRAEEDRSS